MHTARWMTKLIYSFKIVLLKEKILELPKGSILAAQQFQRLERFVLAAALFYVPWWLRAGVAADSPVNDLSLIKSIQSYSLIDQQVSTSAMGAFKKHLWYLTEELIPLALFSSTLNDFEKKRIAEEIKKHVPSDNSENRFGAAFGKPQFPDLPLNIMEASLEQFVGKDSWSFFRILKLESSFLDLPVESWDKDEGFKAAKTVVKNLKVVNDSAERGVKLFQACNSTGVISDKTFLSIMSRKHFAYSLKVFSFNCLASNLFWKANAADPLSCKIAGSATQGYLETRCPTEASNLQLSFRYLYSNSS